MITFKQFGGSSIEISYHGENNVRGIQIDLTGEIETGQEAVLLLRRSGETAVYEKTGTLSENVLSIVWTETDAAIEGRGEATVQITGTGGFKKKSGTARTVVEHALVSNGTPPSPPSNYRTKSEQDAIDNTKIGDAPADGKTYGRKNNAWVEAAGGGMDIHGQTTEDAIADADELAFYDASATGNRKTGWANIKAKLKVYFDGLYTWANLKPASGIPKSDLASGVQTSLGKADTALQEHQSLSGYATESWVEDKGYLTEHQSLADYSTTSQMNTAIAAHHDSTKQDTISDLAAIRSGAALGATAVQPESGKGLSTNDYTTAEKEKLAGIATGAEANVQSDWSQNDNTADDFIKNKPTIPDNADEITYNSAAQSHTSGSVGAAIATLSADKVSYQQSASDVGKVMKVGADGMLSPQAEAGGGTWGSITGTLSDQTDLQNALNAKGTYSKPSGGIPLSDLASAVQTPINGAEQKSRMVTSITASADDAHYPSAKAVYDLVNVFAVNASANIAEYGTVTGTNIYKKGESCTVTAVANAGYSFVKWKITGTSTEVSTSATYTFTVTEGVNLTAVFKDDALVTVSWADGTDAQIAAMVDAADNGIIDLADYWTIGDTRTVSLDAMAADSTKGYESHEAQTVELVIMDTACTGFTLTSSGEAPHFIVGQKDGLLEKGQINSSNTNVGGWGACKRRGWCNDVYRQAIPSTLRGIFKQFSWQYVQSGNSGTLLTANDYFALPPEKAIFGTRTYSRTEEAALFINWAYYNNQARRVKKTGTSGSAYFWLECSPHSGSPYGFCYVSSDGNADSSTSSPSILIAPFGCI